MIRGMNGRARGIRPLAGYLRKQQARAVSVAGHTEQQFYDALGTEDTQQQLDALFCYQRALYAKVDALLWQGKTVFLTYIQSGVNNWVSEYVLLQRNAMPYRSIRLILFLIKDRPEQYAPAELAIIKQANRRIVVDARREEDLQRRLARWSSLAIAIQFPSDETQYDCLAAQMGIKVEVHHPQDLMRSIQDPP